MQVPFLKKKNETERERERDYLEKIYYPALPVSSFKLFCVFDIDPIQIYIHQVCAIKVFKQNFAKKNHPKFKRKKVVEIIKCNS